MKKIINGIYEKHTNQDLKTIGMHNPTRLACLCIAWRFLACVCLEEIIERDTFMSAEEAKTFGIIDHVVTQTPTKK